MDNEVIRLKRYLDRMRDVAPSDDSRAMVESMIANVDVLDEKLRAAKKARQIAEAEALGAKMEREKSYQDGYAEGVADGFGECSALMSKMMERKLAEVRSEMNGGA